MAYLPSKFDGALRACVVGTSNGVMRQGYASGIGKCDGIAGVDNYSIGFSSSALFAFREKEIDFARYDICFLDFSCNDASLFQDGFLDDSSIRTQVEYAIYSLLAKSCVPFLIIMPIRKALPDGGAVRNVYVDIAEKFKIPFFDGYAFLEILKESAGNPLDFFMDDMHLAPEFANLMGTVIAKTAINAYKERCESTVSEFVSRSYRFIPSNQTASCLEGFNQTQRISTTLVSADYLEINANPDKLKLSKNERVDAVAVNFSKSKGLFILDGATRSCIRLTTSHYDGESTKSVLGLFPIKPVFGKKDDCINLYTEADCFDQANVNCSGEPVVDGPYAASVAGFVVSKQSLLLTKHLFSSAINVVLVEKQLLQEFSNEYRKNNLRLIEMIYQSFLMRRPDPVGEQHCLASLIRNGRDAGFKNIILGILDSHEYKSMN